MISCKREKKKNVKKFVIKTLHLIMRHSALGWINVSDNASYCKTVQMNFCSQAFDLQKCQRKIRDQTIHLIFCYTTQNKKFNHVSCLKIRSIEKSLENAYQNLKT